MYYEISRLEKFSVRVIMAYTIEEHKHRLAAWDAGRSASVMGCRFKVEKAKGILEVCGFDASFSQPEQLPARIKLTRLTKIGEKP